ncbi:hypothetical protein DN820_01770 [Stutzerimonas nosocomialis]|uniref:Uncharacterized protein n=1 Tax=Stutzerimonas nosocomialis TaxID=1056496 RepID=A0A5R9R494_9GAMM|nr:hypothetical protein [Stutzerimonas nosocomialis]TLX65065.1 hypothetical protein DN820_01770 [Stutzerimonas nosocomialis]
MPKPRIMLGGVPIVLHAGAPEETIAPIGGSATLRMSGGAGVKMEHWQRWGGTISGSGWMPPGLAGLDYSQPLELRSTKVLSHGGAGPVFPLLNTPRPDVAPWAQALLGDEWVTVPCVLAEGEVTVPPVAGASLYQVCYMPIFSVFCDPPAETQSAGTAAHGWTINWEET